MTKVISTSTDNLKKVSNTRQGPGPKHKVGFGEGQKRMQNGRNEAPRNEAMKKRIKAKKELDKRRKES